MKKSKRQIYLLYGNDQEKLNKARTDLVASFLSREEREENYVEFYPPGNQKTVPLSRVMPDLLAELGTVSFFQDSRRVVVLYNLKEIFSSRSSKGPKKKQSKAEKLSHEAYFIKYLEDQLPQTDNIIILVNTEDFEKRLRINLKSNLLRALSKIAHIEKYSAGALVFAFEDALRNRDLTSTLAVLREWFGKEPETARRSAFYSLVRQISLILQVKVMEKMGGGYPVDSDIRQLLFPSDMMINYQKERDFNQKKIKRGARLYTTGELISSLRKLLEMNVYIYPSTTDEFVPDIQIVYEQFLVELMART